jgi:hypothetical protein
VPKRSRKVNVFCSRDPGIRAPGPMVWLLYGIQNGVRQK